MGIAVVVFLLALPLASVVLAARLPNAAALRRLSATVGVDHPSPPTVAVIARRLRRRRLFGAIGAVLGLWSTAGRKSVTSTWSGPLPELTGPSQAGFATGRLGLVGPSFVLVVHLFGILAGFAVGVVLAEWTGRRAMSGGHRATLLAPRDARRYVAPWARRSLVVGSGLSGGSLVAATAVPESLKRSTGSITDPAWWAIALLGIGVAALLTRALVVARAPRAVDAEDLVVGETTRALTAATMTLVALAMCTASTASTPARMSTWFGWGWGDGLSTAALASSLIAVALVVAGIATPYGIISTDLEVGPPVAVT